MHVTLRIVTVNYCVCYGSNAARLVVATCISAQAISNFIRATVQAVESMIGSTIVIVTPVGEPRRLHTVWVVFETHSQDNYFLRLLHLLRDCLSLACRHGLRRPTEIINQDIDADQERPQREDQYNPVNIAPAEQQK